MATLTREAIIEAAKRVAAECGGVLSRADFERLTGISQHQLYKAFPDGGWTEVLGVAGIQRHPLHNEPVSDEELLTEFHRVASELGQIPTGQQFGARANLSYDVVKKRFGGMQGTLRRYRAWLEEREPASPMLAQVQAKSKHEILAAPSIDGQVISPARVAWPKGTGPQFGPPINFRGLRHAPINEQGVVFLFGMVSYEIGFIVEAIQAGYPDCEAKRCVDHQNQRWQRVRIEFEYWSTNFKDHCHDPAGCDLIVCWEHDWPDCPLEVVELRRVIDQLVG
jgi:Homing endonuclease associated repeat